MSIDLAYSFTMWLSLNLFPHLTRGTQAAILNTGCDDANECVRELAPHAVNGNSREGFWVVSEIHPGVLCGLGHYLGEGP